MDERILLRDARIVGGLGNKLDSIGLLQPVYCIEDRFFTGTIESDEIAVTQTFIGEAYAKLVSQGGAVRLRQTFFIPGPKTFICLTKDIAKQLAHVHCLTKEHALVPTLAPEDRVVVGVDPESVQAVLTVFGEGLLKASEEELKKMVSRGLDRDPQKVTEHGDRAYGLAHTAIYRCFTPADRRHRISGYVRIIASLDYRKMDERARFIAAHGTSKLPGMSVESFFRMAKVLWDYLRQPSGTFGAVRKVGQ